MPIRELLSAVAIVVLVVQPVQSQTTATEGAATSGSDTEGNSAATKGLQEIIVTARKRNEDLQQVPIAVSVLSQLSLQQHQVLDAFALPSITPSLQVQSTTNVIGAQNFSIRGVGTAVYGPQVESSVGVVIDDVVMGRAELGVVKFFDLDHVEVLRGPQGMLFGKNASAGLVNIVTAAPVLGETQVIAYALYGNMNSASAGNMETFETAVNLPVTAESAVRINGFIDHIDGFDRDVYRDQSLGETDSGVRLKYLWLSADSFRLTLSADLAHENGPAESVLTQSFAAPGGFIAAQNTIDGVTPSSRNADTAANAPIVNQANVGGAALKGEFYPGSDFTLTNITAYRSYQSMSQSDTDATSADLFDINRQKFSVWQATEELRLTSPGAQRLSYQGGLFFMDLEARQHGFQGIDLTGILPPPPPALSFLGVDYEPLSRTRSSAGYFEGKFNLLDDFRFTAGARYTHDDVRYQSDFTNPAGVAPLATLGLVANAAKQNNVSYRAGLDYDIAPSILVYVSYSRGYKGPTFDSSTAQKVAQEISRNYEIGVKSELLDHKLRLNGALFHTSFDGYQAQALAPGNTEEFIVENAGNLGIRGGELEVTAVPLFGLTITGGTTYIDSKYSNYSGLPCYFGEPAGAAGRNVCFANGTTDVSGNQLANAPKWTTSLTTRYEHSLAGRWVGFVQGDVYHRSSFNYTATVDPQSEIGSTAIFGLSAGASTSDGRLSLTAFVRNLGDKRIPTFILEDPVATSYARNGVTDAARGGDYWHQLGLTSFRIIGLSVNYRL